MQYVNVQVLIVFDVYFWFYVYWDFMIFDFIQFVYCNYIIFCKIIFGVQVVCFVFFVIQQLERVEQVVVCCFSNLDISNYLMFFRQCLFDFGFFVVNW